LSKGSLGGRKFDEGQTRRVITSSFSPTRGELYTFDKRAEGDADSFSVIYVKNNKR
jgi:hypothetical protein